MLSAQPTFLSGILGLVAQPGVVESGGNLLLVQPLGHFFGLFPITGVDNGRTCYPVQDVQQLFGLVFGTPDNVGQVLPFETHPENIFFAESQSGLDVFHYFGRSGSGQRQDRIQQDI